MYRLKYTKAFEKDLKKLSPLEQKTVAQKLKLLTENPFYPSLRTKKVQGLNNVIPCSALVLFHIFLTLTPILIANPFLTSLKIGKISHFRYMPLLITRDCPVHVFDVIFRTHIVAFLEFILMCVRFITVNNRNIPQVVVINITMLFSQSMPPRKKTTINMQSIFFIPLRSGLCFSLLFIPFSFPAISSLLFTIFFQIPARHSNSVSFPA